MKWSVATQVLYGASAAYAAATSKCRGGKHDHHKPLPLYKFGNFETISREEAWAGVIKHHNMTHGHGEDVSSKYPVLGPGTTTTSTSTITVTATATSKGTSTCTSTSSSSTGTSSAGTSSTGPSSTGTYSVGASSTGTSSTSKSSGTSSTSTYSVGASSTGTSSTSKSSGTSSTSTYSVGTSSTGTSSTSKSSGISSTSTYSVGTSSTGTSSTSKSTSTSSSTSSTTTSTSTSTRTSTTSTSTSTSTRTSTTSTSTSTSTRTSSTSTSTSTSTRTSSTSTSTHTSTRTTLSTSTHTSTRTTSTSASSTPTTCSNPNIRFEWRSYSDSDRHAFVNAINCLINKPPSGNFPPAANRYEDLVRVHQINVDTVHGNSKFLLWHRYYVWTFEQILRDECGFNRAFPWWDEGLDAGNFAASSIFTNSFFGSLPKATNGMGTCITNGAFANLVCHLGPGSSTSDPHCLARAVDESLTSQANTDFVNACNSRSSYADMENCAELGPHAYAHNGIGSVMSDVAASPSDPIFFLHHLFIDRNFWLWQGNDATRLSQTNGCVDNNTPCTKLTLDTVISVNGLRPDVKVRDVINPTKGVMCYKYTY